MISMIPKVNLGFGEMGFMFVIYTSLLSNPLPGDKNS